MTNAFCYAGYTWRVFSHNRFAGYVVAMSEFNAMKKAQDKYGKNIWIERVRVVG
jgi:hypothetical protein